MRYVGEMRPLSSAGICQDSVAYQGAMTTFQFSRIPPSTGGHVPGGRAFLHVTTIQTLRNVTIVTHPYSFVKYTHYIPPSYQNSNIVKCNHCLLHIRIHLWNTIIISLQATTTQTLWNVTIVCYTSAFVCEIQSLYSSMWPQLKHCEV